MEDRRLSRRALLGALTAIPAAAQQAAAPPADAANADMDVFLLAGQSNMAGRGVPEAVDQQPIPGVFKQAKEWKDPAAAWQPAIDPLHFDKPAIAGVGLGRSFAKTLLDPPAGLKRIGLIPAAMGGSSLDEWKPDGPLFRNAVDRAKGSNGKLRGILWHQGEADANQWERARSYAERATVVFEAFRRELGPVPIIVGELGRFIWQREKDPFLYARLVNEQLASLAGRLDRVAFVPSHDLLHKGDELHFDSPSLRTFGRRYALAWQMVS